MVAASRSSPMQEAATLADRSRNFLLRRRSDATAFWYSSTSKEEDAPGELAVLATNSIRAPEEA